MTASCFANGAYLAVIEARVYVFTADVAPALVAEDLGPKALLNIDNIVSFRHD